MNDQDRLALGEKRAKELCLQPVHMPSGSTYYHEATIFKLLGEGVEVWSHINGTHKPAYWGPRENGQFNDTHCGLTIGIRPLVQESEERKLLREFLNDVRLRTPLDPRSSIGMAVHDLCCKIRKLLERP